MENTNYNTPINDDEMAISEHIEEFSQRLIFCLGILISSILICFEKATASAFSICFHIEV